MSNPIAKLWGEFKNLSTPGKIAVIGAIASVAALVIMQTRKSGVQLGSLNSGTGSGSSVGSDTTTPPVSMPTVNLPTGGTPYDPGSQGSSGYYGGGDSGSYASGVSTPNQTATQAGSYIGQAVANVAKNNTPSVGSNQTPMQLGNTIGKAVAGSLGSFTQQPPSIVQKPAVSNYTPPAVAAILKPAIVARKPATVGKVRAS